MIHKETLHQLQKGKNLLAYSAGVDSSALFHLLLDNHIQFDIAIVHYNLRKQAKEEIAYAKTIAKKYNLTCHLLEVTLQTRNVEMQARDIRYNFFRELMQKHHYCTLLTAHQLNDKTEWFLMQFTKGSSLRELIGMQEIDQKKHYKLIRPLLHVSKAELYNYLHVNNYHYFEDATNHETTYTRNKFRHNISNYLLDNHAKGIAQSFRYLQEEHDTTFSATLYNNFKELYFFKSYSNRFSDIKMIDTIVKSLGTLIRQGDRERLKQEENLVIARKYSIAFSKDYVYIAPYIQSETMSKVFKERCRKLQVPKLLRPYLFSEEEVFTSLCELLESR